MNKYTLVALSATGGLLSGLAWTDWCTGLILLISFIPFYILEDHIFSNRKKYTPNAFFIYLLPGFVMFSLTTLGWMRVASMAGAISVILGLSFFMAFTMWLAHIVRLKGGNIAGFISFIVFWLAFELISLNVNIISPWLNLGNGLSKDIMFIQWYEVTGTAGGSLWILLSNLILARFIISNKRKNLIIIMWLIMVLVPSAISFNRYSTIKTSGNDASEVIIIQPNIDPYSEKFVIPFETQLEKVISMAGNAATGKTSWIVTPETTVDDPVNLDDLDNNLYIRRIRDLAAKNPQACIITGLVSYRLYPPSEMPPTKSARKTGTSEDYYDHFNSAFRIDTGKIIEVYHKSKLVPGIEMQFSTGPGRMIARILPYLGGTRWGYGMQDERNNLNHPLLLYSVAPVICYESVFGSYVTDYVRKGAKALFIITNDGWWKGTDGYMQHLSFASLRAIETRRPVIRSANTGISCIIDIRGKRMAETEWWTREVLKGSFIPENRITPYVKYGDYILRISLLISLIIILINFVAIPIRKRVR